eukprot:jgi/Mesvir1/29180/Mv25947-RA.2
MARQIAINFIAACASLGSGRNAHPIISQRRAFHCKEKIALPFRTGSWHRQNPKRIATTFLASGATTQQRRYVGGGATKGRLHHFFATCAPGLEEVVAMELMSANICASKVTVGKAGVEFTGDMAVGYRANLWLRSAVRVLLLLSEGPLDPSQEGGDSVYEFVKSSVDWPQLLHDGRAMRSRGEAPLLTFSVDARVALCSTFNNSHMASTRAKDAICDALRDATGSKPPKPQSTREADVPLFLSLFKDNALLYRDMSGQSLHKRHGPTPTGACGASAWRRPTRRQWRRTVTSC